MTMTSTGSHLHWHIGNHTRDHIPIAATAGDAEGLRLFGRSSFEPVTTRSSLRHRRRFAISRPNALLDFMTRPCSAPHSQ
jgi:hypothetical protein